MYSCVYRAKQYLQPNSHPRYGLIVHSKGTRFESHRFKIERTGSTKYSGLVGEARRESAGGDDAARRAMPTSFVATGRAVSHAGVKNARAASPCGGQSAGTRSFDSPRGPLQSSVSSGALAFGLCSGHSGKRDSVGVGPGSTAENAGDIAHLEDLAKYFAFCSLCQELFRFLFVSDSPLPFFRRPVPA